MKTTVAYKKLVEISAALNVMISGESGFPWEDELVTMADAAESALWKMNNFDATEFAADQKAGAQEAQAEWGRDSDDRMRGEK